MTRLHRCSPYRCEYGANTVKCLDCGRTWLRGAYRYTVANPGQAPDATTSHDDARRKAVYE